MNDTVVNDKVHEKIGAMIRPIFEDVLQEELPDSMTTMPQPIKMLWRPNNYRRVLSVKSHNNSTYEKIKSTIDPTTKLKKDPHTKTITIRNYFPYITLQLFKEKLMAIWSQRVLNGDKETFLITAWTMAQFEERVKTKKKEIEKTIDMVLLDFAKKYKLLIPFSSPRWVRAEDWTRGEEFIESIPRDMIIHDEHFKKVYGRGIEFTKKSDNKPHSTVHMTNYIREQMLGKTFPELKQDLIDIKNTLSKMPLRVLAKGTKPRLTVYKLKNKITKIHEVAIYKKDLQRLSDSDKFEMMKHIKPMLK